MLVSEEQCRAILRGPRSKEKLAPSGSDRLRSASGEEYPILHGKPVLIDFSDSVLSERAVMASKADSQIARTEYKGVKGRLKRLVSPEKQGTADNVARLIADLEALDRPARLLVVGGGSVGQGMGPLYDHPGIQIYSFDIYDSPMSSSSRMVIICPCPRIFSTP